MDGFWAKLRWAIAKTFATRLRRHARPHRGRRPPRTIAPRFFTTARRIFRSGGDEIAHRLAAVVGEKQAAAEVSLSIERIFSYAAWADKFDGAVHNPPFRNVAHRDE